MSETLSTLSVVSFIIAGISFAVAVFLWFFFRIPYVYGDLSGKTAKKSIDKMRLANEKTGSKSFKTSKVNAERGKLTETIESSSKKQKFKTKAEDENKNPETGLLEENKANLTVTDDTMPLYQDETKPLNNEGTQLLDSNETEILGEGTELLSDFTSEGTDLLDKSENTNSAFKSSKSDFREGGVKLKIIEEVMLTFTDEVIT